jgi:MazG family protein
MQEPSALGRIVELVRELRKRCPWDAAQTPESLRPYLVEEALELDHAIAHDPEAIRTELGDLLLHVAFQVVLAEEAGRFGAEDLTRAVERKMWRRHPHLYPEKQDGAEVRLERDTWERTKLSERGTDRPGVLDGLPPTLPELLMAYRLQERAAGVGFDWPDTHGPIEKVREELGELERESEAGGPKERLSEEVGDLLFAVINLSRKLGCDPRAALECANEKFTRRFRAIESLAAERGIDVGRSGLDVLDRLWNEVKEKESD